MPDLGRTKSPATCSLVGSKDVDARRKAGHDEKNKTYPILLTAFQIGL